MNVDFLTEQQKALERMRELSKRSKFEGTPHKMPPVPSFVKVDNEKSRTEPRPEKKYKHEKAENDSSSSVPFSENFGNLFSLPNSFSLPKLLKNDGDTALILGLLLILYSEKSDRLLMLALLYILI